MIEKFAAWIIRNRFFVIALLALVTVFFAWKLRSIDISSRLSDLLPQNHPFIKVHKEYEAQLGDPFKVYLMVSVKDGTIYNEETLGKIKRIDLALHHIPGVNHNQVYSIASRKVTKVSLKPDGVFVEQLMPCVPGSDLELLNLQKTVRRQAGINGIWVSPDERCALFTVAFIPEKMEFGTIFKQVQEIVRTESDDNNQVYAAGEPMLVGWVYQYQKQMYWIFGVTLAALFALLFLYFRNLPGVIVPVMATIMGGIWGLGICVSLGYNLEPLTLVIPLIILARALSHSVQITERYFECFDELKDVEKALVKATSSILPPGMLGIATDAAGIFLIAVAPVPMMQKLAFLCGYWASTIIVTGLIGTPVLLSLFSPPKNIANIVDVNKGFTQKILEVIARLGYGKAGVITFGIMVALFVGCGWISSKVNLGDIHPGSPVLWQDSEYNIAIGEMNKNFPGTEELVVIFEANEKNPMRVFDPAFLDLMDRLQSDMAWCAGRSLSLGDLLSPIGMYVYGGNPIWDILPTNAVESRQANFILKGTAAPDDFDKFFSRTDKSATVVLWFKDHTGATIRKAVKEAEKFIDENDKLINDQKAKVRLASGTIGLLAAMNETVEQSQVLNFMLVMAVTFLMCAITYRSLVAPIVLMIPLTLANLITLTFMYFAQIGLNVNTLPIVSVGVGVGIDYGIYLLSRICEERQKREDYSYEVPHAAIKTTGKAIFFTATTMVAGVIFWYFLSSLRFQAEMGLLLAIIMVANMVGALLCIPAIVYVLKPKFLAESKLLIHE